MASRVVPAIGVTSARDSPNRALNSDDFPALGGPAITTNTPSRRTAARGAVSMSVRSASRSDSAAFFMRAGAIGPSSSSGKSMS